MHILFHLVLELKMLCAFLYIIFEVIFNVKNILL